MVDLSSWSESWPYVAAAWGLTWATIFGYAWYVNGKIRQASTWLKSRNQGEVR